MATTLMPVDPAVSTQRVNRLLTISARLLPNEIIAGRRGRRTRLLVIVVVVIVALLCGLWIWSVKKKEQEADRKLTTATNQVAALQRDQRDFTPVVQVKNEITQLEGQLKTVMTDDLDWGALLSTTRDTGPDSIEVSGVSGRLASANDGGGVTTSAGSLPSTSTTASIGMVTITGTAPDKEAVAAYVDALGRRTGTFANPYVTSVSSQKKDGKTTVTFSVTVEITGTALCGRFGEPCTATGGK